MKLEYLLFDLLIVKVFGNIALHSGQLNKLTLNSALKDAPHVSSTCTLEAKCEPLNNATCFGTAVPYSYTSFALAEDSISPLEIQDNLALWRGLRAVPRCWAVVQPLLCAVYMPKCENGTVFLPSQEMCKITRYPCRAIEMKHTWPAFLRCENKEIFPSGCRNPLQEVKFNTSSRCVAPLVETDNPDSWFHEVEGCGLQCQSPFFTTREHESTHGFIKVMASISFAVTLFTVLTFLISWKNANRYPAVIIFYINACLAVASFGWLIQFFSSVKEEIVCLPDGTVRRKQPRSGEHLCSITFILIYSFIMAALVWFVILAYAWHVFFKKSGVPKDIVKKKVAYFHLAAWCTPLVLTTTVMAMKEVDGDSMSGICFVGYANHMMRAGFLLVPVLAATFLGGFFLIAGICTLCKVKLSTTDVANTRVKKRIHRMIFKIGMFSLCALVMVISTLGCHAYDFAYRSDFEEHLREYIVCLATSSSSSLHPPHAPCVLKSRPNLTLVQLHFLSFFGFGIMMASWVWNRSTLETWRRFFHKFCQPAEQNALTIKRHQLIAKAFQHRNEISQGHFSLSLNSTHDDPIGMNMEVNSIASREVSSTFASALPQFLSRRNAVATVGPLGVKHYSSASDVSARRISLDSFHQQNLDSLSLQISEQEYAHVLRHQRRKTRKEREKFLRANRIAPWFPRSRRGSDTSLQSSVLASSVIAAAAARFSATKVTKATSTGDLVTSATAITATAAAFSRPPSHVVNRQMSHKQAMPNLPFTHGMTDNSHSFNISTRKKPPESGYLNPHHGINSGNATTCHSPFAALYNQIYGYVPPVPLGYMPGSVYPALNALYHNYLPMSAVPNNQDCLQYAGSYMHFSQNPESLPDQQLLQLHPTMDSASEADYLPIVLTDSEFTDGGHRSFDEAQLMAAQKLIQDCHTLKKAAELERTRSRQSQTDSHLQFPFNIITPNFAPTSNIMGDFNVFPSGKRSPHSEAPPPSPVDSETAEDFLMAFNSESLPKSGSKQSLQSAAGFLLSPTKSNNTKDKGLFEKIKTSIKRAASFSHDLINVQDMELDMKTSRMSLRYDEKEKSPADGAEEILLGRVESDSIKRVNVKLSISDACNENISR